MGTVDLPDGYLGFYFYNGEGGTSKLMGFTIRNGFSSISGAAVSCMNRSPWIAGNRFVNNHCDGDWQDDIVVGCGLDPNAGTPFKVFRYRSDGTGVEMILFVDTSYPLSWSHETRVSTGRL